MSDCGAAIQQSRFFRRDSNAVFSGDSKEMAATYDSSAVLKSPRDHPS
jgi:hypothetical protein